MWHYIPYYISWRNFFCEFACWVKRQMEKRHFHPWCLTYLVSSEFWVSSFHDIESLEEGRKGIFLECWAWIWWGKKRSSSSHWFQAMKKSSDYIRLKFLKSYKQSCKHIHPCSDMNCEKASIWMDTAASCNEISITMFFFFHFQSRN